jgi:hypothetical protein
MDGCSNRARSNADSRQVSETVLVGDRSQTLIRGAWSIIHHRVAKDLVQPFSALSALSGRAAPPALRRAHTLTSPCGADDIQMGVGTLSIARKQLSADRLACAIGTAINDASMTGRHGRQRSQEAEDARG